MVVPGRKGRRNGHTCGTWSRSCGVQERYFGCTKACFWDWHYIVLDLWTLHDANHTRSEATRRFQRIFAVKKQRHVWQTNTMDQNAGEWSTCEGFFPSIFCGRGCRALGHQCVATRVWWGTARGRGRTINVSSMSLDRPSLRNTSYYCKPLFKHGQKVATMKNEFSRRGWWHQRRIDVVCYAKCMFFSNERCVRDARMVDN